MNDISKTVEYKGDHLESVEYDLISIIDKAVFTKPLNADDSAFLQSNELRNNDHYVDINPYGKSDKNNLKYSTGKIFYYTYQKNSIVLKANSSLSYQISKSRGVERFMEFDAVYPDFNNIPGSGKIKIYYTINRQKKLLSEINISREKKPRIKPFRYSDLFASIVFYLRHPGRSVLPNYVGWEKNRINLPAEHGILGIEFEAEEKEKNYLFIGSPAIYSVLNNKRDNHVNILYLIFDCFSKNQIDIYEYPEIFSNISVKEAFDRLGKEKILTPAIDKYFDRIFFFENMQTAGQVTRASIVPLWTSQTYTRSRQPVFRNIVTEENKREFYEQGFTTLGNELSRQGYFTKQISCNAQGHGVAGVGVDLGFDENYDYTMEASERTENFRRIIEFLEENQNRKFFLYSHINVPHTPMWIPMKYFINSLPAGRFNPEIAKVIGNIRYLNDSFDKIMTAVEKLKLLNNTIIIITADHSGGRIPFLRGEITQKDLNSWKGESQNVADFHDQAIYIRKGYQHLLNDYMNIPWMLIIPSNQKFLPGKADSFLSSLDISPTLFDIAVNGKTDEFSGKSFKNFLTDIRVRDRDFNKFIPLVGRFQRGFIIDGRYKYWINIKGLYKYREANGKKYIMQQEYLFDLKNDPDEIINLADDQFNNKLLNSMRKIFFEKFEDYPDKNFIQISPSSNGIGHLYTIDIKAYNGKLIYPKTFGDDINFKFMDKSRLVFTCPVKEKEVFISFETDPSNSVLNISVSLNNDLLPANRIFTSVECVNYFGNPITLKDKIDFHIAREPGKTGLEKKSLPENSVYFSRIPLNYWMEMNLNDKDIQLSPGIKEVLRGWGYIQ